ncbi:putative phage tail assembly chaperone [Serratia marcescens]|nr:putative phage tail assembly chaperone [Serratia marcescens]MBN5257417.1 putative phage tail assembly chaperone [Serratia marcescens]MBN5352637.1 putative phage tail assembly chaperone [Serratia marcescens]HEJ8040563.1 putative phage tail assembly chaperone [Serratia marcescens]HEJ8045287.1 putative phage tail assembly chaperone [Serratia marcescens]
MSDKVKIEIKVNGLDLVFEPNVIAFNKFINEMSTDNKVAPASNFLRRIVHPDSKDALDKILSLPGGAVKLAGKVNEIYSPELEFEVKN